jgi:hypothetical protein
MIVCGVEVRERVSNKAMQTDGRFAAAADRQDVRRNKLNCSGPFHERVFLEISKLS